MAFLLAEDEGFEFAKESPLVAKWPHLVSLSSDQFSKCTVCTIWNILRKSLKGKNKGKLLEIYVPPSHHNTHSRCRKFAEIFGEFFFVPEQEKLAELFGYYCYSNNSAQQQNRQGNKTSKDPSTVDIWAWFPVAAQRIFYSIFESYVCLYSETKNRS